MPKCYWLQKGYNMKRKKKKDQANPYVNQSCWWVTGEFRRVSVMRKREYWYDKSLTGQYCWWEYFHTYTHLLTSTHTYMVNQNEHLKIYSFCGFKEFILVLKYCVALLFSRVAMLALLAHLLCFILCCFSKNHFKLLCPFCECCFG